MLTASLGQTSLTGCRPGNQGFYGGLLPDMPVLATKSIVMALTDGINASRIARQVAEMSMHGMVAGSYDTPD